MSIMEISRTSFTMLLAVILGFIYLIDPQSGYAQESPKFATIRANQFSDVDRNTVKDWISNQLDQIFAAEDPETALSASQNFFKTLIPHLQANNATGAFKNGVIDLLAAEFEKRYKTEPSNSKFQPMALASVLTMLKMYPRAAALNSFLQALKDPAPGIRLLGADGILALRTNVDNTSWTKIIETLDNVGVKETSPIVLSRYYRILEVNTGPRVETSIPVMLKILDSRFTQFEKKGLLPARAEAQAVSWLGARAAALNNNNDLRNNITLRVARVMADAVNAYLPLLKEKPDEKNKAKIAKLQSDKKHLEEVIEAAEQSLKTIAAKLAGGKAQPSVTKAMLEGGSERAKSMNTELENWIGSNEKSGFLNAQPFGLKPGLDIKRPAPESAAPAE